MSFMRKILDVLNMENWVDKKDIVIQEITEPNKTDELFDINNETVRNEENIVEREEKEVEDSCILESNNKNIVKEEVFERIKNDDTTKSEIFQKQNSVSCAQVIIGKDKEKENEDMEQNAPYKSNRLIIKGLHIYFIDIAREIVSERAINVIPLMREYHLTENDLNQIIGEIQEAKILDLNRNVTMNNDELEKFIDIYEPSIFDCTNSVFDKEIFMVMGEIIFDKGVKEVYSTLSADEVIDYLNIMEKLKIIAYDCCENKYNILTSKEKFDEICEHIPNSFASRQYIDTINDYSSINYDNMSGIEFEKYCAYILSENDFSQIKFTPASGDHGIDILAEKDGITYAIQCKCYSSNIGNAAVQQAHTGKSLYHKDIAVVLTNRYFTSQAKQEAEQLGVKLWDRDKLNEMIKNEV